MNDSREITSEEFLSKWKKQERAAWAIRGWSVLVEEEEEPTKLFNPWHDVGGRFTDKAHAAKPMPEGMVNKHGIVTDRTMFLIDDAASLAYERAKMKPKPIHVYGSNGSYVKGVCSGSTVLSCSKNTPRTFAIYRKGEIHVGPKTIRQVKRDRRVGEYILTHEALHGTKRAGGKTEVDTSVPAKSVLLQDDNFKGAFARHSLEESTTDLLARKLSDMTHKDKVGNTVFYMPQMGAIAIIAGIASGWDQAKAWRLIEQMHYNINNDKYIFGLLDDAFGTPPAGWNGGSWYAMLMALQKTANKGNYQELGWLFSDMEKLQ